jgi:hypothetical protein
MPTPTHRHLGIQKTVEFELAGGGWVSVVISTYIALDIENGDAHE